MTGLFVSFLLLLLLSLSSSSLSSSLVLPPHFCQFAFLSLSCFFCFVYCLFSLFWFVSLLFFFLYFEVFFFCFCVGSSTRHHCCLKPKRFDSSPPQKHKKQKQTGTSSGRRRARKAHPAAEGAGSRPDERAGDSGFGGGEAAVPHVQVFLVRRNRRRGLRQAEAKALAHGGHCRRYCR